MTHLQRLFVAEYAKHENASAAARVVGVAVSTALNWLKQDDVRVAVEALQVKALDSAVMSADEVLRELTNLARADIAQLFNEDGTLRRLSDMTPEARRSISGLEVDITEYGEDEVGLPQVRTRTAKLKRYDKLRALELLGKRYKLFTDKLELELPGRVLVQFVTDDEVKSDDQ